jgi:hypothetical protein
MDKLYDLKDKLCEELENLARKPDMGPGDLELIHKLTDTIKNIGKIEMLEEEGGYSQEDGQDGGGYGRGVSYARGRGGYNRGGRNTRRDSRGRYSRDDGRSEMMEHLEMALDSASDQDRETIKRFMRQLENA